VKIAVCTLRKVHATGSVKKTKTPSVEEAPRI